MNAANKGILIPLLVLLTGCATSLGEGWDNFRARYNIYYNATQSFERGLRNMEPSSFHLQPRQLVRIYPSRRQSGQADFAESIEKSETILRKFPESKWADDALYLKARSHYHRDELYQGLRSFERLQQSYDNARLRQESVLWKSRILFDLERYRDGAAFLENEIPNLPAGRERNFRAEAKALQAEHYIRLGNWQEARRLLGEASSELQEGEVRSRTLFLFGQVLERMGADREAYFAYANVSQGYPEYEYILWSRIKQAQAARRMGNTGEAKEILADMQRDDKNYTHIDLISMEIGRAMEAENMTAEAGRIYRDLLNGPDRTDRREVRARAYYRLGIIHSNRRGDYGIAAAYFDSAAAVSDASTAEMSYMDEAESPALAASYRQYAQLKERSGHLDSLLWLGSLPVDRRDSLVAEIRERRIRQLKESRNRESEVLYENPSEQNEDSAPLFGFLNYRNPRLAEESKRQFRSYWGDRPLVDHWRRSEITRSARRERPDAGDTEDTETPSGGEIGVAPAPDLNLEEIPATPAQRDSLRERLAALQLELGNLFFLEMNRPDSARHYFRLLEMEFPDAEVTSRAMYALFELYRQEGETDSARAVRERLISRYYAGRLGEEIYGRLPGGETASGEENFGQRFRAITGDSALGLMQKAQKLTELARSHSNADQAPLAYFKGVERYAEAARQKNAGPVAGDSLRGDSLLHRVGTTYRTAAWDSVRLHLDRFLELFPGSELRSRAASMRTSLDEGEGAPVYRCSELNISLTVRGGLDDFMEAVDFPNRVLKMELEGEIRYRFRLNREGEVTEYRLLSPRTGLGIEEALEEAFDEYLRFHPVRVDGEAVSAECEFVFPLEAGSPYPR